MAELWLNGRQLPLLCLHRLAFKQDWSLPWHATSHVRFASSFALFLLGWSTGGQFLPLAGTALGEGDVTYQSSLAQVLLVWHQQHNSRGEQVASVQSALDPCQRSKRGGHIAALDWELCTGHVEKMCVFHMRCSSPVLWECNSSRVDGLPTLSFWHRLCERFLQSSMWTKPSWLLPMILPKTDSLQILKQLILLHLHHHSCSQKNTINSFSRLKLMTFIIGYCNCPSPNMLQDTLWVLKTSIQMSVKEECLERKTLQNKLLWGKLNKIPMEVHENKYCGVQQAPSHGAQATVTWMNKEGGDEIHRLHRSRGGWGFLSDVSASWNTREEPLGSAHTLRFWRHHPQLLLNIQSHGKRF